MAFFGVRLDTTISCLAFRTGPIMRLPLTTVSNKRYYMCRISNKVIRTTHLRPLRWLGRPHA